MSLDTPRATTRTEPRRLHHITRIDIEPSEEHPGRHPTHGWQVRARRDGERQSKFFADARHDGSEPALAAAIAYRDRLLASLPDEPTKPRKAWSNTGVVGLSLREKEGAEETKLYVQLNWVDAQGKRKSGSYSVAKWGLRRALWNGCLKLYRERQAAGSPVEEAHVMFARAQEPFQDLIRAEIETEQAAQREAEAQAAEREPAAEPERPSRPSFETAQAEMEREDDRVRQLEDALFG